MTIFSTLNVSLRWFPDVDGVKRVIVFILSSSVIMSGDKTKAASQTDWKMAQNKMSEMGMASYKVRFHALTC